MPPNKEVVLVEFAVGIPKKTGGSHTFFKNALKYSTTLEIEAQLSQKNVWLFPICFGFQQPLLIGHSKLLLHFIVNAQNLLA